MTTCARCNRTTGYKLPLRQSDGSILYFHVNASECQPAALSPESNTEAAQQNAAELEQAPHPAACICDECLKSANSVWELQHPRTGLLHEVRQRNGYYDAPKTSQPSMFAATNADLPLFSGTAPRAHVSPFVESEVSAERQPRLF